MARFTFQLPDIGEGISEAEIVAWHVAVGDRVEEDQQIADMMTDKATVEMESPVSGTVVELAGEVGDQVSIGAALVVIETERRMSAEEAPRSDRSRRVKARRRASRTRWPSSTRRRIRASRRSATPSPHPRRAPRAGRERQAPRATGARHPPLRTGLRRRPAAGRRREAHVLASPAVRARAADLGVDLASVKTEGDRTSATPISTPISATARARAITPRTPAARATDEPIKVIGMRRRIAENMAASKRAIPHFTYVDEIDVTALEDMRADLNANRGGRPKLTMLPLLIVAICRTIPDFPMLNARYDDEAGVVTRHGQRPSRHGGADRRRADRAGDPRRAGPQRLAARDRDRPPRRSRARRQAEARRDGRRHADRHLARAARRHRDDAGDQPPRSRDHRPQQDRRAPGLPAATTSSARS